MRQRVYIERMNHGRFRNNVASALEWLGWERIVAKNATVFIKPNYTYPFYKPGVTTSPELLEAVISVLRERTPHIRVGESDGGAHAWRAEEAFKGHRVYELADQYGIEAVNLTKLPREVATTQIGGKEISVELPSLLLHDVDVFITMPVPKVHVMTQVSLGFKNQWGCLPDVKRLRNHPQFTEKVLAINKLLKPKLVIFDGTYFLDRTGPMDGEAVQMDLLIASNDIGTGSLACCDIMQIDPTRIRHLQKAMEEGMMPRAMGEVNFNTDISQFRRHPFTLQRTWINWVTLGVFHSSLATHLIYDSPLAKPIHDLLYALRGKPEDVTPQW
ncbi:DUF362 domain-containing protein [Candidatus Poribacteria bacterium]|nr:DUF362 domain-containing protein [Candidatus Poribacteria bacterium]